MTAADRLYIPARSLILGWSDKVVAIVNQLCNANESEGGLPIVILSEHEKVHGSLDCNPSEANLTAIICVLYTKAITCVLHRNQLSQVTACTAQ